MRTVLAGGLAAICLAMTPALASAHDDGAAQAKTHGHAAQLAELRAATAPFRSGPGAPWTTQVFDVAGITCIADPNGTGTMGIHFVDAANLADGKVSRLAPEALIFEPEPGGSLTLIAVEYLVFADAWDAGHSHPPILYGQTFTRVAAGNRYGLPAFYELHVWHERSNPNGIFNDWNPNVHCS
jgi:hypothetical protein